MKFFELLKKMPVRMYVAGVMIGAVVTYAVFFLGHTPTPKAEHQTIVADATTVDDTQQPTPPNIVNGEDRSDWSNEELAMGHRYRPLTNDEIIIESNKCKAAGLGTGTLTTPNKFGGRIVWVQCESLSTEVTSDSQEKQ